METLFSWTANIRLECPLNNFVLTQLLNLANTVGKYCHFFIVVGVFFSQRFYKSHPSVTFPGDILQASDDLSHVINSYKKIVEGQTINGETEEAQQTQSSVRQGTF